jgi:8-oxo-dGTP pyrophosphatase MutT (NUDIX family)
VPQERAARFREPASEILVSLQFLHEFAVRWQTASRQGVLHPAVEPAEKFLTHCINNRSANHDAAAASVMSRKDNPWTTLSVRKVYGNPWLELWEERCLDPSGRPALYGRVSFCNKAVGIIPLDDQGQTWLVGQYRYCLNRYSWEIPMGGSPHPADVLESARRELREETGLSARRWEQILCVHTSNSVTDEEGYVFTAEDLERGEPEFESTEKIDIRRLPVMEAVRMVMDGEITDALSAAGLLKLAAMRGWL